MDPYIFGARNGVHVIDLEQTRTKLQVACDAVQQLAKNGKIILLVGTKDQARGIIRESAERVTMPYVVGRWLGGTLTNFSIIRLMIQKYRSLIRSRDTGELQQKYTKFEQSQLNQEINRLEIAVGGISTLETIPDALVIIDIKEEETAVREAKRKGVTTFAICDSNVDPTLVTYPIPGNDDAVSSIRLLTTVLTTAIREGLDERARDIAKAEAAPVASAA